MNKIINDEVIKNEKKIINEVIKNEKTCLFIRRNKIVQSFGDGVCYVVANYCRIFMEINVIFISHLIKIVV